MICYINKRNNNHFSYAEKYLDSIFLVIECSNFSQLHLNILHLPESFFTMNHAVRTYNGSSGEMNWLHKGNYDLTKSVIELICQ